MSFFKSKRKDINKSMDELSLRPMTSTGSSIMPSRSSSPPIPTPSQVHAQLQTGLLKSIPQRVVDDDLGPPPGGPLPEIRPLLHPAKSKEDEAILNILPSYQMYKSTVSRTLTPSHENFKVEPPTYELTPSSSAVQSGAQTPLRSPTLAGMPPLVPNSMSSESSFNTQLQEQLSSAAQQQTSDPADNLWENTILANAHKLKNLTNTDNKISNDLKIKIHFTEKVGQIGVEPVPLDPLSKEFKQGDYLHGYVTMENTSSRPISFEMVYIVFEGCLTVLNNANGLIDTKKPITVFKFLNMIDLFASWTFANIDRLVTDNGDPHDWCDGETDPYDNTILSIDINRTFEPHIKYKRFFTFRIPEKLLDDSCEMHDLTRHQEVPPSIGVPRLQVNCQTQAGTTSNSSSSYINNVSDIKDFAFVDTSISYSVDARVIGNASDFDYKSSLSSTGDEYIVAKETSVPIRVVPLLDAERLLQLYVNKDETKLFYRAFAQCVKSKINQGREILHLSPVASGPSSGISNAASPLDLTPMNSIDHNTLSATTSGSEFVKIRQLYNIAQGGEMKNLKVPRKSVNEEQYQSFLTYKKKSLTGAVKSSGILSLSTPKAEYRIAYQPPLKFRGQYPNINNKNNTLIQIPMELQFLHENQNGSVTKSGLPEFKEITTELTVFTVKSKKHTIPVEFYHDLLFHDQEVEGSKRLGNDNFDGIVVRKFQNYIHELTELIKKNGPESFPVENRLFNDIKAMAFLQTKYIHLAVEDVKISTIGGSTGGVHNNIATVSWSAEEGSDLFERQGYSLFFKRFNLNIDLLSAHFNVVGGVKANEQVCLLPDFQTCLMARMYYLKICFKTTTNQMLTVNVPVIVENLE